MLMYNEIIYILKIVLIMTAKSKSYKSLLNIGLKTHGTLYRLHIYLFGKNMFKLNLIISSIRNVKKLYKTNWKLCCYPYIYL